MSEGLKAVEFLSRNGYLNIPIPKPNTKWTDEDDKAVGCGLLIAKELKALEIIIDKRCNFNRLIYDEPSWEEVVENWLEWFDEEPTLEEYNLLMDMIYE